MIALRLARPMESPIAPEWSGAMWIGGVDVADLPGPSAGDTVVLLDSTGYSRARLLVRRARAVLGFVELAITDLPVVGGSIALDDLWTAIRDLPDVPATIEPIVLPTVSVVICTRDRASQLRGALTSVLALDYPSFEVVVVDNAPATTETQELVAAEFADPRVRLVTERIPGLSRARNTGLVEATGEIVAYTDDDVVVDSMWLHGLVAGFARGEDVTCVTGLVPSGELRTPVQRFFDDRVSWSRNLATREFRLAEPPADLPMFPFSVGEYGTGANFALRRDAALELGGFDTAFGVGTRTGGGEDLDIFTRVLFAGGALVVEPSALVWHRHRADLGALQHQAVGYGTGLGAWLTKVALSPSLMRVALKRLPSAVKVLAGKAGGTLEDASVSATGKTTGTTSGTAATRLSTAPISDGTDWAKAVSKVGWTELLSVAKGPALYARQRFDGTGLIHPSVRSAAARATAARARQV